MFSSGAPLLVQVCSWFDHLVVTFFFRNSGRDMVQISLRAANLRWTEKTNELPKVIGVTVTINRRHYLFYFCPYYIVLIIFPPPPKKHNCFSSLCWKCYNTVTLFLLSSVWCVVVRLGTPWSFLLGNPDRDLLGWWELFMCQPWFFSLLQCRHSAHVAKCRCIHLSGISFWNRVHFSLSASA